VPGKGSLATLWIFFTGPFHLRIIYRNTTLFNYKEGWEKKEGVRGWGGRGGVVCNSRSKIGYGGKRENGYCMKVYTRVPVVPQT